MNNPLCFNHLLEKLESQSETNREKGTSFENLVKIFLENDKTYSSQFDTVYTYGDWAKSQQKKQTDIGIDLVAKNRDEPTFTAIQCKFFDADSKINKKDIDSFIAASIDTKFNRRIFVDTTEQGITTPVLEQIQSADSNFSRIGLDTLQHSSIDWSAYSVNQPIKQNPKKTLRPHQKEALDAVVQGFETADRGKMIMACGTGKTYTALKIAEKLAGENKSVLFLAPSLVLISQSITEWTQESDCNLHSFAVCSDTKVGKRKLNKDDIAEIDTHDLAYPATTDAKKLTDKYYVAKQNKMTVVFATYQSIDVLSQAQLNHGFPEFDLVICDEAHRTTGVTLAGDQDSNFVRVHDQNTIKAKKRLYMTATPRVYITQVKKKAEEKNATLHSMDNEQIFGKELYTLKFGQAVDQKLLSDYKVLILALDEGEVAADVQQRLSNSDKSLNLDDVTKIVGCYKALNKKGVEDTEGTQSMRRAVAFCRDIKSSKLFRDEFSSVINEYQHSTAQHSTAQHSTAQHSTAQHSTAQHSTAQHSTAQHSTAQHSTAQHSTAQHSTAQHSTAQHSTAQHSTAQHSTAQHSTAQHSHWHAIYSMSMAA